MQHLLSGSEKNLSQKASYLRLASSAIADGMKNGGFLSLFKGRDVEFSGVREYLRGDDVRSIDWNVTARMSRPYVKVFDEDREISVFLIVDRSFSMFTGSKGRCRYESAAEAAALLTLAAEHNECPVGAVLFDGNINFSCSPEYGRNRSMLLLSKLDCAEKIQNGSVLENAIKCASGILKNKALVFIISDFRTDGWQDSFKLLCKKNEVCAIRITDFSERALPQMGAMPFTDVETGKCIVLPTFSEKFKSLWREDFRKRTAKLSSFCAKNKAGFISISTEDDVLRKLLVFFDSRETSSKHLGADL